MSDTAKELDRELVAMTAQRDKALEALKLAEEFLSDFYATYNKRSPAWIRDVIKELEG